MIFMERINLLLRSSLYRDYLGKVEEKEKDRVFCKHGFNHSMEVARLCWIFLLENGLTYARDVVYAAALLHDLGRCEEDNATVAAACHALRSARLAEPLLAEAGYSLPERKLITDAIAEHRKGEDEVFTSHLSYFLRRADKYSRLCGDCPAAAACYKKDEMPQRSRLLY
ncbi:MAG TPA: phosphohydrolase [Firmicutes bacterium]|nr:phosphohydrolase [Bacillota bacterium]